MLKHDAGIEELVEALAHEGYHFTTVTPATHSLLNARPGNQLARSVRDIFGWNRPFEPTVVPPGLFELMRTTGACVQLPELGLWTATIRIASLDNALFVHSPFPTQHADAVFFGPDTYRFVRAVQQRVAKAQRLVDVGCGTGAAGIALAKRGMSTLPVVLADLSADALQLAQLNARLAGVTAEVVQSDVLRGVSGEFDLIIANPPYLVDQARRVYRHGGGDFGEGLAQRIVHESIERLSRMLAGGSLLLYSGSPIVDGRDYLLHSLSRLLSSSGVSYEYEELDPDIFGDELEEPAYTKVERIAAVLLQLHVEPAAGPAIRREEH